NSRDASEERLVLSNFVGERRKPGRHLPLHYLKFRAVHSRTEHAINRGHAIKRLTSALHGDDRVLERGCCGALRNLVDFGKILGHGGFESRLEVGNLHLIKRWYAAISAFPFR